MSYAFWNAVFVTFYWLHWWLEAAVKFAYEKRRQIILQRELP